MFQLQNLCILWNTSIGTRRNKTLDNAKVYVLSVIKLKILEIKCFEASHEIFGSDSVITKRPFFPIGKSGEFRVS